MELKLQDLAHPGSFQIPVRDQDPDDSEPINFWMFPDGRLRGRHLNPAGSAWVYREWIPTAPGASTSSVAAAAPAAAPVSFSRSYPAAWSASYRNDGVKRTDDASTLLVYGYTDGTNGRGRSLLGFDHTSIASDLSGSTVTAVYITMMNLLSVWPSGSTAHLGIHNYTSAPTTWAGGGIPLSMSEQVSFSPQERKTFRLPLAFATMIRDGSGKGIALESPSDDAALAGAASGFGGTYEAPVLTVEYAK